MRGASICPNARRCSRAAIFSCAASWCCPTRRRTAPDRSRQSSSCTARSRTARSITTSSPTCTRRTASPRSSSTSAAPASREGKYLQNFHVLSDDVVAAVRWLRTQPGIDGNRIHLAGFSQGGWIAPLAALKDGNIRSVLVGYGVMVPVTGEDRWGYVYALQQKGFGDDAVAAADRVNAVIEDIFDRRKNRWSELGSMLDAARVAALVRGRARQRLDAGHGCRQQDAVVGRCACISGGARVRRETRRSSTGCTIPCRRCTSCRRRVCGCSAARTRAHRRRGRCASWRSCRRKVEPVQVRVFPDADHGIIRFVQEQDGERRYIGHRARLLPGADRVAARAQRFLKRSSLS